MIATRFVIQKIAKALYVSNTDLMFTAYLDKAKTFKTYPEAEAHLNTLPDEYYQIDKIFKVKK